MLCATCDLPEGSHHCQGEQEVWDQGKGHKVSLAHRLLLLPRLEAQPRCPKTSGISSRIQQPWEQQGEDRICSPCLECGSATTAHQCLWPQTFIPGKLLKISSLFLQRSSRNFHSVHFSHHCLAIRPFLLHVKTSQKTCL